MKPSSRPLRCSPVPTPAPPPIGWTARASASCSRPGLKVGGPIEYNQVKLNFIFFVYFFPYKMFVCFFVFLLRCVKKTGPCECDSQEEHSLKV